VDFPFQVRINYIVITSFRQILTSSFTLLLVHEVRAVHSWLALLLHASTLVSVIFAEASTLLKTEPAAMRRPPMRGGGGFRGGGRGGDRGGGRFGGGGRGGGRGYQVRSGSGPLL